MKKNEVLKAFTLNKLDDTTVNIRSKEFDFFYMLPDPFVKPELKGKYRYLGGLQSNYHQDSVEHKNLEKWLCELAEAVLGVKPRRAVSAPVNRLKTRIVDTGLTKVAVEFSFDDIHWFRLRREVCGASNQEFWLNHWYEQAHNEKV